MTKKLRRCGVAAESDRNLVCGDGIYGFAACLVQTGICLRLIENINVQAVFRRFVLHNVMAAKQIAYFVVNDFIREFLNERPNPPAMLGRLEEAVAGVLK